MLCPQAIPICCVPKLSHQAIPSYLSGGSADLVPGRLSSGLTSPTTVYSGNHRRNLGDGQVDSTQIGSCSGRGYPERLGNLNEMKESRSKSSGFRSIVRNRHRKDYAACRRRRYEPTATPMQPRPSRVNEEGSGVVTLNPKRVTPIPDVKSERFGSVTLVLRPLAEFPYLVRTPRHHKVFGVGWITYTIFKISRGSFL